MYGYDFMIHVPYNHWMLGPSACGNVMHLQQDIPWERLVQGNDTSSYFEWSKNWWDCYNMIMILYKSIKFIQLNMGMTLFWDLCCACRSRMCPRNILPGLQSRNEPAWQSGLLVLSIFSAALVLRFPSSFVSSKICTCLKYLCNLWRNLTSRHWNTTIFLYFPSLKESLKNRGGLSTIS